VSYVFFHFLYFSKQWIVTMTRRLIRQIRIPSWRMFPSRQALIVSWMLSFFFWRFLSTLCPLRRRVLGTMSSYLSFQKSVHALIYGISVDIYCTTSNFPIHHTFRFVFARLNNRNKRFIYILKDCLFTFMKNFCYTKLYNRNFM